jgi:hypothetical protein
LTKKLSPRKNRRIEMKNNDWITFNKPYGPIYSKKFEDRDSFSKRHLNKPGTLIETDDGVFLIGDINPLRGVCDDCIGFKPEVIVKKYKIIYESERAV